MTDLAEALRWALAELRGETQYKNEAQRTACFARADDALAEALVAAEGPSVGMSEANAPIPAVQSGAVAWHYFAYGQEFIVKATEPRPPRARALVYAAPQSEPLPGGVGEADVRLLMKARSAIEAGLATLNGLGAKVGGRISLMATTSAEITARLSALSGREQG